VNVFRFTLVIEGGDLLADATLDALYEAGCDDATFGVSNGVQIGGFDREAAEFADAVASAIRAIESTVPGAKVVALHRELAEPRRPADYTRSPFRITDLYRPGHTHGRRPLGRRAHPGRRQPREQRWLSSP
jgi:hypothetical protein